MLSTYVLVFFIVLLNLQDVSGSIVFKLLPLVGLGLVMFQNKAYYGIRPPSFKSIGLGQYLLLALLAISSLRSNNDDISFLYRINRPLMLALVMVVVYFATIVTFKKNKFDPFKTIQYVVIVPFLLASLANLALWVVGWKPTNSVRSIGEALLLSYAGIHIDRVEFPLSPGFNSTSTVLGGLVSICIGTALFYRKNLWLTLFSTGVFVIQLILIDTRSALIYSVLVPCAVYLLQFSKKILKFYKLSFWLVLAGPFLMLAYLPLLASNSSFQSLSRSAEDLETGNARFLIWGFSFQEMLQLKAQHLIGYGEFGHFGAGVSKLWAFIFSSWENSELKSPHNTFLSIFFDYGYLGVIVYLFFLYRTMSTAIRCVRNGRKEFFIQISFVVYTILIGFTESTFGFYFTNFTYLFFSLMVIFGMYSEYVNFQIAQSKKVKQFAH